MDLHLLLNLLGGLDGGVVHRLDYETSGAVVFALNQFYWDALRTAFKEHKVKKIYHAIVYGNPKRNYLILPSFQQPSLHDCNLTKPRLISFSKSEFGY